MLLFPNSCIKESHHTIVHCSRDVKVLYMLCITIKCVKSQQNYLFKKSTKCTRSKKIFKKELLHRILIYLF